MTRIKDLNRKDTMNDNDILPVWDGFNASTRSVSFKNLREAVPYIKSAAYIYPDLVLQQSNGEAVSVNLTGSLDIIDPLVEDHDLVYWDQSESKFKRAGASVDPTTGVISFDKTISVPSGSLNVGDVITLSEGGEELLVRDNIMGTKGNIVSSDFDDTGSKAPSYLDLNASVSSVFQPDDSTLLTANPLEFAFAESVPEGFDIRQSNQFTFRAAERITNLVFSIVDRESGVTIKYVPSKAAFLAETPEQKAANPGLTFEVGDNIVDFISTEPDSIGVSNVGLSPFRLRNGQIVDSVAKADNMALLGSPDGLPYLFQITQDGKELNLSTSESEYVEEIIAGENITVDNADPKKPVISASGGGDKTNFVGLFKTLSDLETEFPEPEDGMYASLLDENGKPDTRYKSDRLKWESIGEVSGEVYVNETKSKELVFKDGLKYEDKDGVAEVSLSGRVPQVFFDVSIESTRYLDSTYVGKQITIIQSTPNVAVPMQIFLPAHSAFENGDVISIGEDDSYVNYYFAVYFSDADGSQKAEYPNSSIKLTRNDRGWRVEKDGRFTTVAVNKFYDPALPFAEQAGVMPVGAFLFEENPGVQLVDQGDGQRYVKVDLGLSGSGFLVPNSADYPFVDNSARDAWASTHKDELVQNETIVNVGNADWYVWRGETNPDAYDPVDFGDATPIVKGPQGEKGDVGGGLMQVGQLGQPFNESEYLEFGYGFTVQHTGEGQDGKSTITLPFAFEQEFPIDPYGNFNDDLWLSLANVRFYVKGKFSEFFGTPFNSYSYTKDPDEVLECAGLNQIEVRDGKILRTVQVWCRYGQNTDVYIKSAYSDEFSNGTWEPMTGTIFETERPDGEILKELASSLTLSTGVQASIIDKEAFLKVVTPYVDMDFIAGSFYVDESDSRTLYYETTGFDKEDTIHIDFTASDVVNGWEQTIVCGSNSKSSVKISIPEYDIEKSIAPNASVIVKKVGDSLALKHLNGPTVVNYSSEFCDVLDARWEGAEISSILVDEGTLDNFPDESINGSTGKIYAEVKASLGDKIQQLTVITSDDNNGRKFERVANGGDILSATLKEITNFKVVVDSDNPIEFVREDTKTNHDAVSVTGKTLRVGSPVGSLELRTDDDRIKVQADGRIEEVAYVSDEAGRDPTKGFDLDDNATIGLNQGSKILYKGDGDPASTILEVDYDRALLGTIDKRTQVRTLDRMEIKSGPSKFWHAAFSEEVHVPHTVWERATSQYVVSKDDLYSNTLYTFEPLGAGHEGHFVLPSLNDFKDMFYIPDVNEESKDSKPSITTFRFGVTIPKNKLATVDKFKLRLSSIGNWVDYDMDGTDVITGVHGKTWEFYFARPREGYKPDIEGWILLASPSDPVDFVEYSKYQEDGVAYIGTPSNQDTKVIDGVGYVSIDRQNPVTADDDIENLSIIIINTAETEDELPLVSPIAVGNLASGFSFCPDGAVEGDQILQISSGTYTLDQMTFATDADVGDFVYVGDDGKLTLTESDYRCGWVINGGVIIDIDLYNGSVIGSGTDDNPIFKTVGIDTAGSGQPNFTALIKQDNELHTVIDATRELRVNYKDVGTGTTTTVFGIDNTQAQFLVPIMQGNDAVALAKDVPVIPDNGYIEKYKRADTDYIQVAYQGKYGDDRNYYPSAFNQDSSGMTFVKFTGNMNFVPRDKETGENGSSVFELREDKVIHKQEPYFNDKKLVAEHTSPILSKLQTQRDGREYPPVSLYVDEYHNTILEANNDFKMRYMESDGTYTQTLQANKDKYNFLVQPQFNGNNLISENTDVSFNKINVTGNRKDTAYNNFSIKGSSEGGDDGDGLILKTYIREDQNPNKDYIQYFGGTGGSNQLVNTESLDSAIAEDKAKGEWIGGVLKDTINNEGNPDDDFTCNDPKQWLEYRKTTFNGSFALTVNQGQDLISSEVVIHLHITSGMASAPFKVVSNDGKEVTRTIRVGEKWRFYLRTGATPYFELIDDGMQSGTTDSDYDGEGFGVPGRTETGHGIVVQKVITGNYRNTSSETGDLTINLRTEDGVKNFRFYYSLPRGTLDSGRKVYVKVDEKAGNNKTIRAGEIWQCEVKAGQFFDDFFWQKITDGSSTFVLEEDFNSKSGYNRLSSGGGSTHRIEFWENGTIFKLSNSKIEVRLLEGMQDEDGKRHGYVKYINSRGSDVNFEWYDRNGNQIINSNVPSVCPADTVVEIFANYSTDDYAINFSQSKVISSSIAEAQTPSFSKFINKSTVTVDYPLDANGDQYRPINVAVMVLDTDNLISDLNINVTSSDSYDGHYNSIGVIAIDSNGEWTTQSRRNGYRLNDGTNTYCVYSDSLNSWVLVVASVDHNHIGSIVGGVPINLYNDGQLPESYGDYSLDNNLDSIESEYFTKADVDIDYHTNSGANSYFTVDFGSAKPAGIVFYK